MMTNPLIVDFGFFTGESRGGISYMTDEHGNDWYQMLKALTTWEVATGDYVNAVYGTFMVYETDGLIRQIEFDPTRIVPWFGGLIAIDAASTDYPKDKQWKYIDGAVVEYIPPVPVPVEISDRQFYQALAKAPYKLITESEALDAVMSGTLPAAFEAFVQRLPDNQQFDARMLLAGSKTLLRNHPLVDAFGMMQGWNADQIDELWRTAEKL